MKNIIKQSALPHNLYEHFRGLAHVRTSSGSMPLGTLYHDRTVMLYRVPEILTQELFKEWGV